MINKRQMFRRQDDYINYFCRTALISSFFALAFVILMVTILPKCSLIEIITKSIPNEINKMYIKNDKFKTIENSNNKACTNSI